MYLKSSTFRRLLDAFGCSPECFPVNFSDMIEPGVEHLIEHVEKLRERIEALEHKTQDTGDA
jgi:hypothetical protein